MPAISALQQGWFFWQVHGRNWAKLQAAIPKKTMIQIKNYYQNYKGKVGTSQAIPASLDVGSNPSLP